MWDIVGSVRCKRCPDGKEGAAPWLPGQRAGTGSAESSHARQIPKGSPFQADSPLLRAGRSWCVSVGVERVAEAGRNLWRERDACFLWWGWGSLCHCRGASDCGVPLQMSSEQDKHLQRPSWQQQGVPVTVLIPSFYLLPSAPCTQPVCVPDTNTRIPPNSRGGNLSTISNFAMASSHCGAA